MDARPRLLDAFCCEGGATRGYQDAGWHVTGVDIAPQPRYCGDSFHQADAVRFIAEHWQDYDAIHASPTCQTRARVTNWRGSTANHPDTLTPTLVMLRTVVTIPWVVENVLEAVADGTMRPDLVLCGSMFGLPVRRHRAFETSWHALQLTSPCGHRGDDLPFMHKGERAFADAMGCDWMTNRGGRQAIPPSYTRHIGELMLAELRETAA
jgi:hypothetical protein